MAADRVIVVLSPKGGTGKTTVSTNLAVGLARRRPGEVVLVDLDLAFGDVAAALLLDPRPGLELVAAGALPRVHPSGLHVVGAPDTALVSDDLTGFDVGAGLDVLAVRYRTLVVDTGAGFDTTTRSAVDRATDLVLVASMDVPTLLGLRKIVRWLDDVGCGAERHLVLNRANSSVGLDLDDVVATTGLEISVAIPSGAAVTRSVNEGRPLTEYDEHDPASAAFRQLVSRLAPLRAPFLHR